MKCSKKLFNFNEPMSINDKNYYICDQDNYTKINTPYHNDEILLNKDYKRELLQQEIINIITHVMSKHMSKHNLNKLITKIYTELVDNNIPSETTTTDELGEFIKKFIKDISNDVDNVVKYIIENIKASKNKLMALNTIKHSSDNIVDSILSHSKLHDTNIIVLEPHKLNNNIHKHINDITNSPHVKNMYKNMSIDGKLDYDDIHNIIKDNIINNINNTIIKKLPEHFSSNASVSNINIVDSVYDPIDMNAIINEKLNNNLNVIYMGIQTHETPNPVNLDVSKNDVMSDDTTTLRIETFKEFNANKHTLISDIVNTLNVDKINIESNPNNSIVIEIKVPDNTDLGKVSSLIINKLNNNNKHITSCIFPREKHSYYNQNKYKNNIIFVSIVVLLILLTLK